MRMWRASRCPQPAILWRFRRIQIAEPRTVLETRWRADCILSRRGRRYFMRRLITALVLGAALGAPIAAVAKDDPPRRYYDRSARDYHEWNEREERAYRHWLESQHRRYRDWNRTNRTRQDQYWRWRHQHPGDDWRM